LRTALDPPISSGWSVFEGLYRDVEALGEMANDW